MFWSVPLSFQNMSPKGKSTAVRHLFCKAVLYLKLQCCCLLSCLLILDFLFCVVSDSGGDDDGDNGDGGDDDDDGDSGVGVPVLLERHKGSCLLLPPF